MITADPYGISGAVAPWRSLDAMEPIAERRITERDTEEAELCGRCPLPDCNPKRVGCLLHTRAKRPKPSRDLLERMALDGYGPETIKKYIKKTDLTAVERGALLQAISNMPTLTPPNEPLTWNELGNMVEKPVYIVELEDGESCWVLVHTVDDIKALFVSAFDQYDYGNRELYGQTWLAYRRPPEGEA